ncbi:13674_t:CDS:2 [Funneliformis mosseae]|uniref:13674_t:CDS:1 n=1 Tax=Funneliformis mosseae TaxID=27381 RepID=A0A9N8YR62_FUNMO|nr:13674_t:CDS:2 [Funneliformis mosseae]
MKIQSFDDPIDFLIKNLEIPLTLPPILEQISNVNQSLPSIRTLDIFTKDPIPRIPLQTPQYSPFQRVSRTSQPYYLRLPAVNPIPIATHTTILIPVIRTVPVPVPVASIPKNKKNNAGSNSDN